MFNKRGFTCSNCSSNNSGNSSEISNFILFQEWLEDRKHKEDEKRKHHIKKGPQMSAGQMFFFMMAVGPFVWMGMGYLYLSWFLNMLALAPTVVK